MWQLIAGIVSAAVGFLILLRPQFLAYIIAVFLIIWGAIAIIGYYA